MRKNEKKGCVRQIFMILLGKKTEFLKGADVQTHICANFSRICLKVGLLNAKQEKQVIFSCFRHNLTKLYMFLQHLQRLPVLKMFSQKILSPHKKYRKTGPFPILPESLCRFMYLLDCTLKYRIKLYTYTQYSVQLIFQEINKTKLQI